MWRPRILLALAATTVFVAACSSASSSPSATPPTNSTSTATAGTPVSPPQATNPLLPTPPIPVGVTPEVSFVDAQHGWIGGRFTTDGGAKWNTADLGSLVPSAVAFTDPMHGWIAGTSSPDGCGSPPLPCYTLQTTADGGHTWTVVKLPNNLPVMQIAAVSPKDGWIVQEYCEDDDCARWSTEIYRTPNGGMTWDSVDSFDSTAIMLARFDASTSWIVTDSYVFRIGDPRAGYASAGNNPCHLLQPGGGIFRQGPVSFSDATHGWMACASPEGGGGMDPGNLYDTDDGGVTWTLVSATPYLRIPVAPTVGDFPGNSGDIRFYDANDGWLAGGYQDGMFHTSDSGPTWQLVRFGAFPENIVYAGATSACAMSYAQLACTTDSGQHWTIHDLPH